MSAKQISLGVLIDGYGVHPASWMDPGAEAGAVVDVAKMGAIAAAAERAKFDLFFVADTPATRTERLEVYSRWPIFTNGLEPVTMLSAIAGATSKIGLGATVSTSFFEPYNIARQFASLDHITGGRAAWNVVTSANDYAARNFGLDRLPPHAERYAKAAECVEIVRAYWDTWEDDAFVFDKAGAVNFDPAKFHAVDHDGPHFKVHGGLNVARPPQGHPVIIQAGSSDAGKELAAQTAEVVFVKGEGTAAAKAFYDDLKGRMARYGRQPDELKVLVGLDVCAGETHQDALDKYEAMQELLHPTVGKAILSFHLETNLHDAPLDEPIPLERLPESGNMHKMFFEHAAGIIRANPGITLRELIKTYGRGSPTICGDATGLADHMQDYVEAGAADGFMLMFNAMPRHFHDFTRIVVPELQRRGLFRRDYEGTTLRDHLGLARPQNRHVSTPQLAAAQ